MREVILAAAGFALLAGCAGGGGVFGRKGPDEFAVSRAAPLVVPPDFALTPPAPGAPRPQEADSSTQALQAMFGGAAVRSASESGAISQAGGNRAQAGIRSDVGDPGTNVVDKGSVTRDVIAAPEGDGQNAKTTTPQ
jgi:Protein of unknown function (DUF3035)